MKRIQFSSHAKRRMKERSISRTEALSVIARPQHKKGTTRQRFIVRKAIAGRILEVIYTLDGELLVVITLYFV